VLTTATPSRIRDVCAAAKASDTKGSSTLRYPGSSCWPAPTSRRWNVHTEWYPSASARAANPATLSGRAHAPDTGNPNPISMKATLTAYSERFMFVI
jgi:hypothetical protein